MPELVTAGLMAGPRCGAAEGVTSQPGQRASVRCVICMDSEAPSNDGSTWGSENNSTSCGVARRGEPQSCRGLVMVWKEYGCARRFLPTRPHRARKKHFHSHNSPHTPPLRKALLQFYC